MKLERVAPTVIRSTGRWIFLYPGELEVNPERVSTKFRYKLRRGDTGPHNMRDPRYMDMHIFLRAQPICITVER